MLYDCHVHVDRLRPEDDSLTPTDLLAWMDEHGVDKIALQSLESPESSAMYVTSDRILEITASQPDRFIAFCSFDPRLNTIGHETRDIFAARIEEYVDRGARGFGEVKCGVPIDHDRMQLIYELCAEYDLPVLLHVDNQCLMDKVGLPNLERMLQSFPDLDFIVHSHGWWSHLSGEVVHGDLDRFANPPTPIRVEGRCAELLEAYDNLYGDLSAMSGWNAMTRDPAYAQSFLERFHEQLIFGTDKLPGFDPPHFELFDRYDLSEQAWANIRHRNLEGLLR